MAFSIDQLRAVAGNAADALLQARDLDAIAFQAEQAVGLRCRLADYVHDCFVRAKRHKETTLWRKGASVHETMMRCLRMRNDEYDPELARALDGIDIYMPLGSMKVRAAQAWIRDTLANAEDKPWTVEPTPVPELSDSGKQLARQAFLLDLQQHGVLLDRMPPALAAERIKQLEDVAQDMELEQAREACTRMEKLLQDQMVEGGWREAFDAAVRIAADTIYDTHYDYSNANRARFMQSGTAKVLLMFKQYSLNTTWHLGRMLWQATKGESPEVRQLARRNLAGVLGMAALFGGVMGLPTVSVTMDVLNAIAASFGDDDEPWDAETEFRNFLADMLGPSAAQVVATGALNRLTGADIAARVSLDEMWFRDPDRELEGRGLYYHLLEQAAGPMGGTLKNAIVGKSLVDDGHLWRGVETVLPKAMKDTMKAIRYAREGVQNLKGHPVIEDVSLWQALLQLTGFTPAQVSEQYTLSNKRKVYEEFITGRRQDLMNAYAMSVRQKDAEAVTATIEKMRAYNRANPDHAITPATIRRSMKSRERYAAQATGGIVLNPKLRPRVMEAVRF